MLLADPSIAAASAIEANNDGNVRYIVHNGYGNDRLESTSRKELIISLSNDTDGEKEEEECVRLLVQVVEDLVNRSHKHRHERIQQMISFNASSSSSSNREASPAVVTFTLDGLSSHLLRQQSKKQQTDKKQKKEGKKASKSSQKNDQQLSVRQQVMVLKALIGCFYAGLLTIV